MVVVFCVSLCGCVKKPTKEELIVEANRYIATQDASNDLYDIDGEYTADYNGYFAIVSIDVDYLCSENNISDFEEVKEDVAAVEKNCEKEIGIFIDDTYADLSKIFEDSDVDVRVAYMNVYGKITHFRMASQE